MRTFVLGAIISALGISHAGHHENAMERVSFSQSKRLSIQVKNLNFALLYFSISKKSQLDYEKIIKKITKDISRDFSNTGQCKSLSLSIYEVPFDTLNNKEDMPFISAGGGYLIDGLYDTRYAMPGNATIFLAGDLGEKTMTRVLSHEIAHYIHDIMCIKEETESFAIRYEINSNNPLR